MIRPSDAPTGSRMLSVASTTMIPGYPSGARRHRDIDFNNYDGPWQ